MTLPAALVTAAALVQAQQLAPDTTSTAYLSRLEREIVDEHNLLREHPEGYARHVQEWLSWFDSSNPELLNIPGRAPLLTQEGSPAAIEAIVALRASEPRTSLVPSRGMSRGARDHAESQRRGDTGHTGGDGSQPWDRVSRYGTWNGRMAENIAHGLYRPADARLVVLSLFIDDGVRSRGHRENILNPAFGVIGVACDHHHDTYGTVCVITYASSYKEARGG